MLLLTFSEFARRVKVRPNAIRHAAITLEQLEVTKFKGKKYLDWNTQEKQWKDYHKRVDGRNTADPVHGQTKEERGNQVDEDEDDDNDEEDIKDNLKLGDAKAKQAVYEARLKRLSWEEKQGNLVPADMVQKEWDKLARKVKKSILSVSNRLAPLLAAESNRFKVKLMLDGELEQALLNMDKAIDDEDPEEKSDEDETEDEE